MRPDLAIQIIAIIGATHLAAYAFGWWWRGRFENETARIKAHTPEER